LSRIEWSFPNELVFELLNRSSRSSFKFGPFFL
jgi:hypothetical protein